MGIIYSEEKEYDKSISVYTEAIVHLLDLPLVSEHSIKIRLYYNLSLPLMKIKSYKESLKYCDLGINECIDLEYLYLFGELHYRKAQNLINLDDRESALVFFKKAATIFGLENNEQLLQLANKQIDKYQHENIPHSP